jgi:hypothetical protein
MGGMSESEKDAALVRAVRDTVEGIRSGPGDDTAKNVQAAKVEASTAMLNGTTYPAHRGLMTQEVLKLPAMVDGNEKMPETFVAASQLARMYRNGLQSDQAFISAFPDQTGRDSAAFYLQYFKNLEENPTQDQNAAYLATVRQWRSKPASGGSSGGSGSPTDGTGRFSPEQSKKLAKTVYDRLSDGRSTMDKIPFIGREGLRGVDNDRLFQSWYRNAERTLDPGLTEEGAAATLAARWQAKYVPVNGRWVAKPSESMAFTPERLANVERALEAFKPIALLGESGAAFMAATGEDPAKAEIYLTPDPVEGGADPKHEVFINGNPTGIRVSITTLERQYNAKTGKYNGDPDVLKKLIPEHRRIAKEMETLADPTPEQVAGYRRHFSLALGAGLITDDGYKAGKRLLDNYEVRIAERQAEELADAKNAAQRNDKATIGLRAPLEESEMMALRSPPASSPDVREALRLSKFYAQQGDDSQLAAGLAGAVLGYHPTRYQNAAGNFVGFGFSLDRDDTAIIADLKQAKVTVDRGARAPMSWQRADQVRGDAAVLAGLRDGSFRLTEVQALRLAEVEWKRAGKKAEEAFVLHRLDQLIDAGALGEDAKKTKSFIMDRQRRVPTDGQGSWAKLTDTTKYALTALRRFTKTDADFVEAVKALDRNDFGTLQKHMITADPKAAAFAPSLVRLLGQGKHRLRQHLQTTF